jgi:hypothetical protein
MPALVSLLGMKWIPCAAHLLNLVVQGMFDWKIMKDVFTLLINS